HVAVAMQTPPHTAEPSWEQVAPHLDHALAELSEPDRNAILLRFFEGKTAREIGERLGLNEQTAQKRVSRALDRLRERFAARGVTVSASTMVVLVGAHAVQSAPTALAGGITAAIVHAGLLVSGQAAAAAWPATMIANFAMTKIQSAIIG